MPVDKRAVYQAFDPRPLGPSDRDLYVPLDDVRGSGGLVREMMERICLASRPTCQILAGHRGSGKSTELRRLQARLDGTDSGGCDQPFFVVCVEGREDLDLNDVDFPEVLVAVVRQLARQVKARFDISLKPGYWRDRWERLAKLLGTEVSFEGLELDAGMFKIATVLKNSPDARLGIRKAMEPDTGNLLQATNDVIGEAKLRLRQEGCQDLVILVDDLDKMILRPHHEMGCSTAEHLFINRGAQLSGFDCHMVYTMPIELAYSTREQTIASHYGYGGHPPVIPMVKVATPPPNSRRYAKGVKAFDRLIAARLMRAGARREEVFDSPRTIGRLIDLSGGQPDVLMVLTREAMVGADLPVTRKAVERAAQEGRRAFARQLQKEHWPLIEEVRRTGACVRTQANDAAFRELLASRAVLQYRNAEEWYGVNPLIEGLKPPADEGPTE